MGYGTRKWSASSGFPMGVTPVIKGRDIEKIMRLVGCSQVQLAAHLGMGTRTLRRWRDEPDKAIPDPSRARDLQRMWDWVS